MPVAEATVMLGKKGDKEKLISQGMMRWNPSGMGWTCHKLSQKRSRKHQSWNGKENSEACRKVRHPGNSSGGKKHSAISINISCKAKLWKWLESTFDRFYHHLSQKLYPWGPFVKKAAQSSTKSFHITWEHITTPLFGHVKVVGDQCYTNAQHADVLVVEHEVTTQISETWQVKDKSYQPAPIYVPL